jgi:hypothetical protein
MRRARLSFAAFVCALLGLLIAFGVTHSVQAAAPLQLKPDAGPNLVALTAKALLVATICLGAVVAGLYVWRQRLQVRTGLGPVSATPSVEWARRISPRTTLLLIHWDGRRYLLAESGGATQLIDSRTVDKSIP